MKNKKSYTHNFTQLKRRVLFIIASLAIAGYIVYGSIQYNANIRENLSQTTFTTLSEIAAQQQYSLGEKISTNIASIKSIAYSLVVLGYERENIIDYLNVVESYYDFNNITILDTSKKGVSSDGIDVDLSNSVFSDFIDEVLLGKTLISTPQMSFYTNEQVVLTATPIFEYGKIVGLVVAELSLTYLNDLLHPTFENRGYAYIVDDYGIIIAKIENEYSLSTDNLFTTLRQGSFTNGADNQDVINSIIRGETGRGIYTIEDETRFFEYRPLPFTGWSVILLIPDEVLSQEVSEIIDEMNQFNISLLIGVAITFFLFIFLRASSAQAIKKAAYYDSLTGISNVTKFKFDVEAVLKKYPNEKFTIVHLDIVNFKSINDFYNFTIGDKVLKAIADTGKTVKHKMFLQCRISSDDFLLFCTYDFFLGLEKKRASYENVFRTMVPEIENHAIQYRYGRYAIHDNNEDINTIINKATLAHSNAKNTEESSICDYTDEFTKKLLRSTEITNKQKVALANKEFKMVLQPKCHASDGHAVGAEALVRWQELDGTMIFPNDFIPLFESNGFIVELDMYMLERVCETLSKWEREGYNLLPISVNFSRRHLEIDNFAGKIEEVANRYGVDKKYIEIELTEGVFLENEGVVRSLLNDLHNRGFKLSMDDFGTGYSSLGLLHSLPVDVIKLDRSFVTSTDEAIRAAIIVESVALMTQKLGIPTVAEGVETRAQVEFLRAIGCEIIQGYYYSKPIPPNEFEEKWLTHKNI